MNITVSTSALALALKSLERIVPAKAILPILSHISVRTDMGHIFLSATDTEISLTRTCAASITSVGSVALPAKPLLDIINQISEPDVHIILEKNQARIAAGLFKIRLQALGVDDFPVLGEPSDKKTLVNGDTLRNLIRKVRPCISETEKRYVVNGALLVLSEKVLALVTTDGKRLAVATTPHTGVAGDPTQVILPSKMLDTLLQDDSDDYAFSLSERQIFFDAEQACLSSRMLEATFPNYQRIIPAGNPLVASVARDLFSAALKRVAIAAGENKAVTFIIAPNMMTLQAKNLTIGDAGENVPITYAGAPVTVNLQAPAVLDFLDCAKNASITMALKDSASAVLFSDGNDFITVAMSVRG